MKSYEQSLCVVAIFALATLAGCTQRPLVGPVMCPAVSAIHQQQDDLGDSYTSVAPGGGWSGENPYAEESYLKGLKFVSAAIRTGQAGPFVARDYEGPEQFAFLRMSRRFIVLPTPVTPNWDSNGFCQSVSGSVADCRFDSK